MVAKASVPGVTGREVSRHIGIAESLIYDWRSAQRRAGGIASEALQFILYVMVVDTEPAERGMALAPPSVRGNARPAVIPALAA